MHLTSYIVLLLLHLLVLPEFVKPFEQSLDLVRVESSGFLIHEQPDILPYAVIKRIQAQQQHQLQLRSERQLSPDAMRRLQRTNGSGSTAKLRGPQRTIRKPQLKSIEQKQQQHLLTALKSERGQMRLERLCENAKHFKLFDRDGEKLLDVKYHATAVDSAEEQTTQAGAIYVGGWRAVPLRPQRSPLRRAKDVAHYMMQV